ncbi:MAG: beta-galactosidase [Anaerolineae bacterium]|nr:beta-galactosidase [Anaerolineae bacterium]
MKYGVQYYPEHWPESRWKVDAEMMQRAGVNVVRMGEFAWGAYEPREGQLDFSWMERAIDVLGAHGIGTILCTCSRTPPPWVHHTYPDIVGIDPDGRAYARDGRYGIGLAHPSFVALSQRIDEAVVRHFAGHDHIVAWQVDNEVGGHNDCYCEQCRRRFVAYLRAKYGTPATLNEAWGANFWSFALDDFDEVPVPQTQPQLLLEYRRFMSQTNIEFTHWRTDLIHELDPGKSVTTNFQSAQALHTDYHRESAVIDVNGMNHYPSRSPELLVDYYRGGRGRVWVMEQHTRLQPVDTPAGWMRLWAWMAVAHGADAVVFFRWRQCRWGQEQFADGLLPHSGEENRFYADLARMGGEIAQIGEVIEGTAPPSQVALLVSYESRWAMRGGRFGVDLDPMTEAVAIHKALAPRVAAIDAGDPRMDLSGYRLVIAPRLWMVDDAIAGNLRRFVAGGGTLWLTPGSGVVDEFGKSFARPRPGPLRDLAGLTVSDLAMQEGLRLELQTDLIPGLAGTFGHTAADELHPEGAEVVATYARGWRERLPAITKHDVGAGRVVYVGTLLEPEALGAFVAWLLDLAGIERRPETPVTLSVYEREADDRRLRFLINWGDVGASLQMGEGWRDAFTGEPADTAVIPPSDLRIFTRPKRR